MTVEQLRKRLESEHERAALLIAEKTEVVKALGQALWQWHGYANTGRQYDELPDWLEEASDTEAQMWQKSRRLHNKHCEMHKLLS